MSDHVGEVECHLASTLRVESRYAETLEADLGQDLRLVDRAAALLLTMILHAAREEVTFTITIGSDDALSGDIGHLLLHTHVFIGIRGWRAMRAARAVIAVGYEGEARAYDRIIVELMAHRHAILEDHTGAEALAWLRGERGHGISKRVKRIAPDDLYKNVSHDSHGDPVAVRRLMDIEANGLMLSSKRTPASRASLLMHAAFARDQAVVVAQLARLELPALTDLDANLRDRKAALATLAPA